MTVESHWGNGFEFFIRIVRVASRDSLFLTSTSTRSNTHGLYMAVGVHVRGCHSAESGRLVCVASEIKTAFDL